MHEPQISNQVQLSEALQDIVRLGLVTFNSLNVHSDEYPELNLAIDGLAGEIKRSLGDRPPSSLSIVERTRRLYHHIGLDPTKQRPSSEKLLRRVLKDKPLPRINSFVDAMNLISLKLQFPLGLYDWDRLALPVLVRIGTPNEEYVGISQNTINTSGKLILVDGEGPFGNPTQDSHRTRIAERTVRALVVLFAPADIPLEELQEGIEEIRYVGEQYCGGQVASTAILPQS